MEALVTVIDRLYSNFLLRDMSYIFTGAVPLGLVVYAHDQHKNLTKSPKLSVAAFLICSYFLGLGLFHAGMLARIVQVYPNERGVSFEEQEKNYLIMMGTVDRTHGPTAAWRLERIIYLKHVSGAMAVALSTLGLVLLLYRAFGLFSINWKAVCAIELVLLLGIVTGILTNRSKARIQADTLRELSNTIPLNTTPAT